jgi:hypothetical protein
MVKSQNSQPTVIKSSDLSTKLIEIICKNEGLQVPESKESYIKIKYPDSLLNISFYLDLNAEKDYIIINRQLSLNEGADLNKIKDLIVKINTKTNFIRAGYEESKSQIDFRYYFWTKDGFTEKSLISALAMFKITYM